MKKIVWATIIVGFITRLFLLFYLPIWHDEAYSIWMTQFSFVDLLIGLHDPVHPPLYYIFLKALSFVSDHLFWLRFTNLALFGLNIFLIKKVAKEFFTSKKSILWTIILYSLSGYFLIFDWQVRMYTGIVSLILLSLFFWKKKKNLTLFITLSLGLLFDYAFFWFYLVLIAKELLDFIESKKKNKELKVILIAGLPFLMWLILSPTSINDGINGIQWMFSYLRPQFFIPFFLGSHQYILTLASIALIFYFAYRFIKKKKNYFNESILDLWFFSIILASSLLILSVFYSPMFHVRSLQVVPLLLIFLLSEIFSTINKKETITILALVIINFSFTTYLHLKKPERLLISFFNWKRVYQELETKNYKELSYFYEKKLATPILEWGLYYTFSGKENIATNKIELERVGRRPENCELVFNNLIEMYHCD